jgi:hypothetical protein
VAPALLVWRPLRSVVHYEHVPTSLASTLVSVSLLPHTAQVEVIFTDAGNLTAFLPTTVEPLYSGGGVFPFGFVSNDYANGPVTNPGPSGDFSGGQWLAEIITGLLNDRTLATYGTSIIIYDPLPTICSNASAMPLAGYTNATIAAAFTNYLNAFQVHDLWSDLTTRPGRHSDE